jgi:hypothetical protein
MECRSAQVNGNIQGERGVSLQNTSGARFHIRKCADERSTITGNRRCAVSADGGGQGHSVWVKVYARDAPTVGLGDRLGEPSSVR